VTEFTRDTAATWPMLQQFCLSMVPCCHTHCV